MRNREIVVEKVNGKRDIADPLAKYVQSDQLQWQMECAGQSIRGGDTSYRGNFDKRSGSKVTSPLRAQKW